MFHLIVFGSILAELQVDINHQCYIIIHVFEINQPSNVNAIS